MVAKRRSTTKPAENPRAKAPSKGGKAAAQKESNVTLSAEEYQALQAQLKRAKQAASKAEAESRLEGMLLYYSGNLVWCC
jgi:hypothetical protein